MTEIWGIVGSGFGDIWASLHWCLRRAEETRQKVRVSTWAGTGPFLPQRNRIEEMLSLIAAPVEQLDLSDEHATKQIGYECWGVKYYETKEKWSRDTGLKGVIAYQFDGRSSPEIKNPAPEDIVRFHAWADSGGLNVLRVGSPFSMRACVKMLQLSEVFIGVCSGMSLLATSVGLPVYVAAYRLGVGYWYGQNKPIICSDLDGFMRGYASATAAVDDQYPLWRLAEGPLVDVRPEGSAIFRGDSHTVLGVWRETPNEIFWENGFRYVFTAIEGGRATVTQHHPSGGSKTCFAVKQPRATS